MGYLRTPSHPRKGKRAQVEPSSDEALGTALSECKPIPPPADPLVSTLGVTKGERKSPCDDLKVLGGLSALQPHRPALPGALLPQDFCSSCGLCLEHSSKPAHLPPSLAAVFAQCQLLGRRLLTTLFWATTRPFLSWQTDCKNDHDRLSPALILRLHLLRSDFPAPSLQE